MGTRAHRATSLESVTTSRKARQRSRAHRSQVQRPCPALGLVLPELHLDDDANIRSVREHQIGAVFGRNELRDVRLDDVAIDRRQPNIESDAQPAGGKPSIVPKELHERFVLERRHFPPFASQLHSLAPTGYRDRLTLEEATTPAEHEEVKMRTGIEGLSEDLQLQRTLIGGRAPSYVRILDELVALLAADEALEGRLATALHGRTFFATYDRPLLILAALRLDALQVGAAHPLHAATVAAEPSTASITREAVAAALGPDRMHVFETIASRYVQTNETSRAITWLWPAALAGCANGQRPLALVDIGASAGLNLVADALPALWTDERGAPIPVASGADIRLRLGLDARPLDASNPDDAAWLRACIWPGDSTRLARLEAALTAWNAAPAHLEAVDVTRTPTRLGAVIDELPADTLLLAYQTVVRDYLPPETARAYRDGMHRLLASAPSGRLAWLELEAAATLDNERPAAITAHLRGPDGIAELKLARTHWHPSSLAVDDAAASRFAELI